MVLVLEVPGDGEGAARLHRNVVRGRVAMHAEICPVCHGAGRNPVGSQVTCYGCVGKGWVEVQNGNSPMPYYPSIYPVYPWWPPYTITWQSSEANTGGEPCQ